MSSTNDNIKIFESRLAAALEPVEGVLIAAVSGGADSTAMLTGLAALRDSTAGDSFVLSCIHVEHGIRPAKESCGDALAVKALCEKLQVPCKVYSIPQGKVAAYAARRGSGIEAAARHFRHRAFREEAKQLSAGNTACLILTAHTQDDLLENLLMRILRGSGPAGLAAMPIRRGLLFRPLLGMTRKDILGYLEERGISYQVDSTNSDIKYLRNRVRLKLIPHLDDFFPSWRTSLLALAETQSLTAEFLKSEARKLLPQEGISSKKKLLLRINEDDFAKKAQILKEEAIFMGINLLKSKDSRAASVVPKRSTVRKAARQLSTQVSAQISTRDLGPVRLGRQDGQITLTTTGKSSRTSMARTGKGFSLLVNEGQNSLVFRDHRAGDRIQRGRHKRSFSDIMGAEFSSKCTEIITVLDVKGPLVFIGITKDGEIIAASRK